MNRYNFQLNVQAAEQRKESDEQVKLHRKYKDVADDTKIVVKKRKKKKVFSFVAEIILWVVALPFIVAGVIAIFEPTIQPTLIELFKSNILEPIQNVINNVISSF